MPAKSRDSLIELRDMIRTFVRARDWEQFHAPKNLAMGLSIEAGELMEHFLWLTPEASESLSAEKRALVADEMGDVFVYLIRLADRLEIDLREAVEAKLRKNAAKYPARRVRGKALKYSEYRVSAPKGRRRARGDE